MDRESLNKRCIKARQAHIVSQNVIGVGHSIVGEQAWMGTLSSEGRLDCASGTLAKNRWLWDLNCCRVSDHIVVGCCHLLGDALSETGVSID